MSSRGEELGHWHSAAFVCLVWGDRGPGEAGTRLKRVAGRVSGSSPWKLSAKLQLNEITLKPFFL